MLDTHSKDILQMQQQMLLALSRMKVLLLLTLVVNLQLILRVSQVHLKRTQLFILRILEYILMFKNIHQFLLKQVQVIRLLLLDIHAQVFHFKLLITFLTLQLVVTSIRQTTTYLRSLKVHMVLSLDGMMLIITCMFLQQDCLLYTSPSPRDQA